MAIHDFMPGMDCRASLAMTALRHREAAPLRHREAVPLRHREAAPLRHREAVRPWRSMTSCPHGLPRFARNDSPSAFAVTTAIEPVSTALHRISH